MKIAHATTGIAPSLAAGPAFADGDPGLAAARPVTQFLSVPGGAIAYDDTGNGRLVVCAPSIGDVRAEYRFLRPQLIAAGFRVVTMDLRGMGESSASFADYSSVAVGSDIVALARHLGGGPAAVIGTSMAGGSAVWAAAEASNAVDRLVLIDAFVRGHPMNPLVMAMMNGLLSRPWGPAMWRRYFTKFYPSQKPADFEGYLAHLQTNLREPGRIEALKAMMNRSDNAAVEDALGRVTAPTLVVMGTKDPDFKDPAAEAGWIARRLGGSLLMLEGAGHYPHAEMPARVGPEIVRFLSGHASRTS